MRQVFGIYRMHSAEKSILCAGKADFRKLFHNQKCISCLLPYPRRKPEFLQRVNALWRANACQFGGGDLLEDKSPSVSLHMYARNWRKWKVRSREDESSSESPAARYRTMLSWRQVCTMEGVLIYFKMIQNWPPPSCFGGSRFSFQVPQRSSKSHTGFDGIQDISHVFLRRFWIKQASKVGIAHNRPLFYTSLQNATQLRSNFQNGFSYIPNF